MSGWEGHAKRECGQHRSTGGRAWCFDCSEWCYPATLCARCELPLLLAERDRYRQALLDIADHSGMAPSAELASAMARRARSALDSDPGLAERTQEQP